MTPDISHKDITEATDLVSLQDDQKHTAGAAKDSTLLGEIAFQAAEQLEEKAPAARPALANPLRSLWGPGSASPQP